MFQIILYHYFKPNKLKLNYLPILNYLFFIITHEPCFDEARALACALHLGPRGLWVFNVPVAFNNID